METLAVTKPRDTARAGGKRAMHLAANPPTGRRLDAAGVQADVRAIDPSKHEVLTALLHVRVPGTPRAHPETVDTIADDLPSHRVDVVLRPPVVPELLAELCEPSVGLASADCPPPRVAALPPT